MMKKIVIFLAVVIFLAASVFVYLKIDPKLFTNESVVASFADLSNCPTKTEGENFKPKSDELMKSKQDNPPEEGGGPTAHNVYHLRSSDQTNFSAENELLLSESSVPDVVKTVDGRELVYFIAGTDNAHGMRVAERQTDGSLEVLNCVTFDGAFEISTVDPNVLLLPDGRLRMVYLSNFNEPGKDRVINSAVSTDGINFTVENVLLSGPNYSDPTETLLTDGSFLLGVPGTGDNLDLYISSDGKNFQRQGSLQNEGGGFGDLIVMPDGSIRFYSGSDTLRMYESLDNGQTWQKGLVTVSGQSSDQHGVGMPSVLLNGSEMEIYYISSKGRE